MKALLEYLLDSSAIVLLHDLQRRKNILMVIPKDHDWCTMTKCNMDWQFLTGPYATNGALPYLIVLSGCTSNAA